MFPDYNHVERLAEALWRGSAYGQAAVMVGAGFSSNAVPARAGVGQFPTWQQLSRRLVDALYPTASATPEQRARAENRASSISGSLRLAEEYSAAYGRSALDDLLLRSIPDMDYSPGPLHRLLLKLPWADVFTTNYDTLLERAAHSLPFRRYQLVTCSADIPGAMRPRIIKLHGSFPSGRPFIFTEEDFRTYPRDRAAMVNMAQQAIIENVFCLIGFSGDDPNFLQWTGWARDHLEESVRQIYLCGILDITPAQRKMLQDRHVMPIDLSPLFPSALWPDRRMRHARALEWLLLCLEAAQPVNPLAWPASIPPHLTPPSPDLPPLPNFARSVPQPEEFHP